MNENNELSDIVLNKGSSSGSNKKMLFAIATLGVILIAVVTLMKSCGAQDNEGAPQAIIPPKPKVQTPSDATAQQEPLFEEVEVIEENSDVNDADLDKIAQKLKKESQAEEVSVVEDVVEEPKKVVHHTTATPKKSVQTKTNKKAKKVTSNEGIYYIQVGSFTKYKPNKKFIRSITKLGYNYIFHKVTVHSKTLNKVLVGPFKTEAEARKAKRILRAKVEPGAFLVKLKK